LLVTEDPKDPKLKLKLANVYEYDAKGVRFSKQANLAEAIAAFRKIEADLPKLKSVAALPEALLYDRQYSDVKKFYEDETNDAPLSYRLAALAVTDGVEAAQKAFDAAGVDASRQSQFTSAAQYLIFLHEYSAAGRLLRAAMQDENESARAEIAMFQKTRRREDARFSQEPPIALAQHLIYALLDPDDEESWNQLFVPEWRDLVVRTERNDILNVLRSWRVVGRAPVGWATTADLAVSNAQFVSEGSDETGYRVRIPDATNNGAMKTVAWIVKLRRAEKRFRPHKREISSPPSNGWTGCARNKPFLGPAGRVGVPKTLAGSQGRRRRNDQRCRQPGSSR
jgi:hypothetical protein